jgi:hypothetical protein
LQLIRNYGCLAGLKETPMPAQPSTDLYAFLDCRLETLSPAARLVAQAARDWMEAARANICPARMMAPRVILAGRGALVAPLHTFLLALAQGMSRPDVLTGSGGEAISEDEALLLVALASARMGDPARVRLALAALVRPHHLADVTHAALLLAGTLRGPDGAIHAVPADRHRRAA